MEPSVAVIDGVTSLAMGVSGSEVTAVITRQFDLLKSRGITTLATALGHGEEVGGVNISSLVDTWLLLRNLETGAERNRLLFVLKSRGSAHSNQVREFMLTDHGIELADVYVGREGVLAGTAKVAQQSAERDIAWRAARDRQNHLRQLRRKISEHAARLASLREELDDEKDEIRRIERGAERQETEEQADRLAMASYRWADPDPGKDQRE